MGDPQDMENIYPKLEYITKLGEKNEHWCTHEKTNIFMKYLFVHSIKKLIRIKLILFYFSLTFLEFWGSELCGLRKAYKEMIFECWAKSKCLNTSGSLTVHTDHFVVETHYACKCVYSSNLWESGPPRPPQKKGQEWPKFYILLVIKL